MKISDALQLNTTDVVAFVGGGGKTTTMFNLAQELATASKRVLLTTSTRIFAAQIKQAPAHVAFDPQQQVLTDVLPQLNRAIDQHGQVLLIGQVEPESGKAFGLPPEVIDHLAATGQFDIILNEADGSRMRPFKAPARHEPVIPSRTTLVVPLVGLDSVGQLLTNEVVHRAEIVSQLSGTAMQEQITPKTIANTLTHPQGGLKNIPAQARVIPLINKVASDAGLNIARQISTRLLKNDRVEQVAIGAVKNTASPIHEVQGRTAIIILAAGGSSRFGSPKQLAMWHGKTFIEQAVETALAVQNAHSVTVVLGAEIEQSQALLKKYTTPTLNITINKQWATGQSTSMQAGLASLPHNVSGAIFLLVDLPKITPDIIEAIIERHQQTLALLVWPEFASKRGNPVLFDRALFPELQQVSGDTGGHPLLKAYQHQAERVAVDSPAILQDFDYPEDLEQVPS